MTNSRDLHELHPAVRRGCQELIRRMSSAGFSAVGLSSTYRCRAYQDHLFAQGRTRPGNIVTNARGGESFHNFRLAFDIFQNIRGQEWSNTDFFATAGRLWREMGGEWGGDWVGFVDRVHFQFTGGLTLRDLQGGRGLTENTTMPWEATATQESFAPSEENLRAMVDLGVVSSPEYWRNISDVRYLDKLMSGARQRNLLDSRIDNGNADFETALGILQSAGIIDSPDYWRNLAQSGKVPYLDTLIINISRRSRVVI